MGVVSKFPNRPKKWIERLLDKISQLSNPNLLSNADLRSPIGTGGDTLWTTSTTAVNMFTNWYCCRGTFELTSDGISVAWDGTNNITGFIQNRIPINGLAGETVTFSAKVNGVVYSETMIVPTTVGATAYTTPNEIGLTFGLGVTSTQLWCTILNSTTTPFTVSWAKLELGSLATPFVPVGYLPDTGGTVGKMVIDSGKAWDNLDIIDQNGVVNRIRCSSDSSLATLHVSISEDNSNTNRIFLSFKRNLAEGHKVISNALSIVNGVDGVEVQYRLFGEHNKPTGTYTGNGDATARTIDTGGIGSVCIIVGNGCTTLVGRAGGFWFNNIGTNSGVISASELNDIDGTLTIASTNVAINTSGKSYIYYVL